MSTILIANEQTIAGIEALAAAGDACPHCDADYPLAADPDAPAVRRLRIMHDHWCPVIGGSGANRAERRAARRGPYQITLTKETTR